MPTMYNMDWGTGAHPVKIEMHMIQCGGYTVVNRQRYGEGLFHHYRALQTLLWPDGEDHHRWSDLMLNEILNNRITAICGSRDSGKTHIIARFGLTDYLTFPNETLILVSSTDLRGLQLRVWGDIKDLHKRALERHPFLAGAALESQHGIFTDEITDDTPVRDMRRGIICIPCLDRKGTWQGGLEKFVGIKQKRRRVLGDECFLIGTMVDTLHGQIPIENIKPGNMVLSANGFNRVKAVHSRSVSDIVRITMSDGRQIYCTPEHPFFTRNGWKRGIDLSREQFILSPYETLQILRSENRSQDVLRSILHGEMDDSYERGTEKNLHKRTQNEMQYCGKTKNAHRQSDEQSEDKIEGKFRIESSRMGTANSWWKWKWKNESRVTIAIASSGGRVELWHSDGKVEWQRLSSCLQSGRCYSRLETSNRSRWTESQFSFQKIQRRKENEVPKGTRVDRVEVLKQINSDLAIPDTGRYTVYNLEVEGHPSYSVNGLLAHNCQFMHREYLTILSNLDKGEFKGVFVGNPIPNLKALDAISEPIEGWNNHPEPSKTEVFPNRYGGRTIMLVGTDSPNFDLPSDQPTRYTYLIDRQDEKSVGDRYGRNSGEYYSQIKGVRKEGLFANRVLTRDMCEQNGAFNQCIWSGEVPIKLYALDAGYGGDRAVAGWAEFGREVGGQMVLRFEPPKVIPLEFGSEPEDQISLFVKNECNALDIPGAHMYFDAGMRATMATSLAKIFSPEVNAVNFGGSPTKRPVSADEYITEIQTGQRRLKRCDEHYIKFVTEMWFSVRLAVLSRQIRELPKDVAEEFYMREWTKEKGDRYELETKDETKKRMGVSPDLADWAAIIMEGARRLGFSIESLPESDGRVKGNDDYLLKELTKYMMERKKHQLHYT